MNKEDAWAWRRDCCSPDGKVIVEFEVMEGPERGKKLYKGKCNIRAKQQVMTPVGPQVQEREMPFEFDFPEGKGLKWCKKNFEKEANSAIKEFEASQKKREEERKKEQKAKIATPNKAVLGPDGKPLLGGG